MKLPKSLRDLYSEIKKPEHTRTKISGTSRAQLSYIPPMTPESPPIYLSLGNLHSYRFAKDVDALGTGLATKKLNLFKDMEMLNKIISGHRCFSTDESSLIMYFENGLAEISIGSSSFSVGIVTTPDNLEKCVALFDGFKHVEANLEWVYTTSGDSITIPLTDEKAPVKEFYPFLGKRSLQEYYDDYMDSDASVLLLIGPPGTAKTSFIRGLMQHTKKSGLVSYDPDILQKDYIFAEFIEGDKAFLILEDADTFLRSRKENNNMMFKFLNVSSSLVSIKNKKLIFSTNLPSVEDIDPALIRPGRCYEVLEFKELNVEQAKEVRSIFKMEETGLPGTVAEILNGKKQPEIKSSRRSIGFT